MCLQKLPGLRGEFGRPPLNPLPRDFWKTYADPSITPAGEAKLAEITSLAVKAGALLRRFVSTRAVRARSAIARSLWILQTFPALIFGLYTGWFRARGLLAGWAVGFSGGIWMVWLNDFKPLHTLYFGGASVTRYSGPLALAATILVAILVSAVLRFSPRGDR